MAKQRREEFTTSSGIELPNDFNPDNTNLVEYDKDLGDPGSFPYTRGVRESMYRGKFWTMRQYAGFATAAESNERYKYLLSQGTTGLSVAFDLPTQIGLDSDDPLAAGEVGKVGVAIDKHPRYADAARRNSTRSSDDVDDDKRNGFNAFVSLSRGREEAGRSVR
jgi:methylmalonyl-CoA mutase N-terminal domain/subunit